MRLFKLADMFEYKYDLTSYAMSPEDKEKLFEEARVMVKGVYQSLIVNAESGRNTAYNIIALLANRGEPFCLAFSQILKNLSDNVDSYSAEKLFGFSNDVLALVTETKNNKEMVESIIAKMYPGARKPEVNEQKRAINKFQGVMRERVASIFEKVAKKMQLIEPSLQAHSLKGGYSLREPMNPSNKAVEDFQHAAASYGLDLGISPRDMLAELTYSKDLRDLFGKFFRSVKRGHNPKVKTELTEIVKSINQMFKDKKDNNTRELENDPEDDPESAMAPGFTGKGFDPNHEMSEEAREKAIRERDIGHDKNSIGERLRKLKEETNAKKIEEDRDRHLPKGEGRLSIMDRLVKKYA